MQQIIAAAAVAAIALSATARAQDIRGLEICTAVKSMDRRTSCLQSNVEFLQQALTKEARETKMKLDAAAREAALHNQEIAALKSEVASLQAAVAALKKPEPAKDKK